MSRNKILRKAAEDGNLPRVKELLQAGANVESKTMSGKTPLIYASIRGHLAVVKYLVVQAGANVEPVVYDEAEDSDDSADITWVGSEVRYGLSPLIEASKSGKLEVVQYLVEQGRANVEAKDNDGETALISASRLGHMDVVKYLVEQAGADVEAKAKDEDEDGHTPLIYASKGRQLAVVKYLVEQAGANVEAKDEDGNTPLIWASYSGHLVVVKYLVEQAGAYVEAKNSWGPTPLQWASKGGELDVVRYLVEEAGANVEAKRFRNGTPLFYASSHGHLAVVRYLVEEVGANVEAEDVCGWPSLIEASRNDNSEVVKYLVDQAGANVEAKGHDGRTPLIWACKNAKLELVEYLVEQAGANADAGDNFGFTPLIEASRCCSWNSGVLKYLVEQAGANVEAKDEDGNTPLIWASVEGRLEVVKYLVEQAGANVEAKNRKGRTAFDRACQNSRSDVISYLESNQTLQMVEMTKRQFYNSALTDGKARPQQIRLLMSGPWGSGKTSIVRSLLGQPFNPQHDSTEGVDIQEHGLGEKVSFSKAYLEWQSSQEKRSRRRGKKGSRRKNKNSEDSNAVKKSQGKGSATSGKKRSGRKGSKAKDSDVAKNSLLEDAISAEIPPAQKSSKKKATAASSSDASPSDIREMAISVKIWDFAGQLEYHAMHQAFFRSNCLYLLVLDLRPDMARNTEGTTQGRQLTVKEMLADAQKWINAIVSSAGIGIGLLIVGTHADHFDSQEVAKGRLEELVKCLGKRVADVEHDEVLRPAPRIVVDNHSGCGIIALMNTIQSAGQKILDTLPDIPLRWLRFSERLGSLKLPPNHFCSKVPDLHSTAAAVGVTQDELVEALCFLDQIGTIIYTDKEESLKESVFLQPHLLLNAMKSLLTHKSQPEGLTRRQWEQLTEGGFLDKESLASMWDSYGFHDQDQLRQILAFNGLIIDLPPCVVVPCLMSGQPVAPLEANEFESELLIQTEFSKHLPPSLFGFLLARMHHEHGVQHQDVGLICSHSGCLTLKVSTSNSTFRVMLTNKNLYHTIDMKMRGVDNDGGKFQDSNKLVEEAVSLIQSMHLMLGERYQSLKMSSFVTAKKGSTTHKWLLLETRVGKTAPVAKPCVQHCHISGIPFSLLDCISHGSPASVEEVRQSQTSLDNDLPSPTCSVFISHTGADKDAASFAGFLRLALNYKHQITPFLDSEALKACDNWRKKIEYHASGCKVFVAIMSEHYFDRFWCLHELDLALRSGCIVVSVFFGPNVEIPKASSAPFAECLHVMLSEKELDEEINAVLNRWLANMTTLDSIQGIRNSRTHKHWMSKYCDEVVAVVWEQLQKQK